MVEHGVERLPGVVELAEVEVVGARTAVKGVVAVSAQKQVVAIAAGLTFLASEILGAAILFSTGGAAKLMYTRNAPGGRMKMKICPPIPAESADRAELTQKLEETVRAAFDPAWHG